MDWEVAEGRSGETDEGRRRNLLQSMQPDSYWPAQKKSQDEELDAIFSQQFTALIVIVSKPTFMMIKHLASTCWWKWKVDGDDCDNAWPWMPARPAPQVIPKSPLLSALPGDDDNDQNITKTDSWLSKNDDNFDAERTNDSIVIIMETLFLAL